MWKNLKAVSTLVMVFLLTPNATLALTMEQFSSICESGKVACRDNPMLGAYVGGALDLIATLNDETDYLSEVYCKDAKDLFDVPRIIDFMVEHKAEYRDKNAMNAFVRYFEEQGGCDK